MPAYRAPRGTRDLLPDERPAWERLETIARDLARRYGYASMETPLFEQSDVFERGIGAATDVVEKELFRVSPSRGDDNGRWALRPEALREILGEDMAPERVFVGVSDADSIPDPDTYRWIAQHERCSAGALAYQGVTLSLANYDRLDIRGKICAIQQSSIFIRVSIARLINEVKRVRLFARLSARAPRLARALRPGFELFFRRSQICLGHNQFVRLDVLQSLGGFPTSGATEDSTLGYALGQRGILIQAMPMVELTDLPETSEKVIRQNARWYLGVLDDIPFLRRARR